MSRNFSHGREGSEYPTDKFLEADACFRGRSVLAPSASQDVSQDNINEIDNRILSISDDSVSWQCFTVKNPSPVQPQTCAVIAEIQGSRDTVVEIEVNGHCRRTSIGELCRYGYSEHMKPYHSQAYKVHTAVPAPSILRKTLLLTNGRDLHSIIWKWLKPISSGHL